MVLSFLVVLKPPESPSKIRSTRCLFISTQAQFRRCLSPGGLYRHPPSRGSCQPREFNDVYDGICSVSGNPSSKKVIDHTFAFTNDVGVRLRFLKKDGF